MTKQRGDRKDGHLVHSDDPMHIFMPYIMGSRTDNEALLNATFDMTAVTEYLKKKNDQNPQFKYTIFHVVIAALAKTIYLRPHMNNYIAGHRLYQRDEISFCFTARNKMADSGGEFVMYLVAEDGNNLIEQNKNNLHLTKVDYSDILGHNSSLSSSCYRPKIYQKFWEDYNSFGFKALLKNRKSLKPGLLSRIINRLKRFVKY